MRLICLLSLIISPLFSQGQVQHIVFSERITGADCIVLAQKIGEISYWDARHENIWTRHTFSVKSYLKNPDTAQLIIGITPGGIVDGDMQVSCPSPEFQNQKQYVLLLDKENFTVNDKDFKIANPTTRQCLIYAGIQGYLPFDNNFYNDWVGDQSFTEKDLFDNVFQITNFKAVMPNGAAYSPQIPRYGVQSVLSGVITSLTDGTGAIPASGFIAGTLPPQNELIINGSSFGSTAGSLAFANIDDNGATSKTATGTDIIYWTDTQIRTKIPRKCGTGTMQVLNPGNVVIASSSIIVRWSEINIKHTYYGFSTATLQQIELINQNTKGGYTFQFSTNNVGGNAFSSKPDAQAAFSRAVANWRNKVAINFDVSNVYTDSVYKSDGVNTVLYDGSLPIGALAVCTARYKAIATVDCQLNNTFWYVAEMDIQIAPNPVSASYTWNYTTGNPSSGQWDFESVLTHELGHGVGLDHINNPTEVMFWSLPNGVARRTLSADEIEAGKYRVQHSAQTHCITSPSSHIAYITAAVCKAGICINCTTRRKK